MITRERAIEVIERVVCSGVIDDETVEVLEDIASCLNMEELQKISPWGMDDEDYIALVTAVRTDLPEFEEHMKRCEKITRKYKLVIGEDE